MENIAADIEDYYGEKRDMDEVRKYQAFQNQVQMTFFPNFVSLNRSFNFLPVKVILGQPRLKLFADNMKI